VTPDPDLAARLAAARGTPVGPAPGPCPEPGEWAALVEGQVADDQRPALEAHLAGCEACLATLLSLETERGVPAAHAPAPPVSRPPRFRRPALAAAALLLALLGLYAWSTSRPEPRDSLELALARLAESHPDVAASAADLTPEERAALVLPPARGGVRAFLPQGLVFDGRPRVRVPAVLGATVYRLRVTDAQGRLVVEAKLNVPDAPWPSELATLAPGQEYVASVEAEGATGKVRALGAFRTASQEEALEQELAQAVLAKLGDRGRSALLGARRLLRLTAYEAAEGELAVALDDAATAAEARALLDLFKARIGR